MATRDSLRESNMVMEIEPSSCGKLFFHTISGTSSASKNRDDLLQVDLGEVNGDAEERETPTEAGIGGLMSVTARSSILPTVNLMALSGCRTLMIDREVFINDQSLLSLFIEDTPNDIDHVVIEHGQHQILIRIAGDGDPMMVTCGWLATIPSGEANAKWNTEIGEALEKKEKESDAPKSIPTTTPKYALNSAAAVQESDDSLAADSDHLPLEFLSFTSRKSSCNHPPVTPPVPYLMPLPPPPPPPPKPLSAPLPHSPLSPPKPPLAPPPHVRLCSPLAL
nr:hypothetical protein Iba_chr15dCG7790 [Ipomoea batatas]